MFSKSEPNNDEFLIEVEETIALTAFEGMDKDDISAVFALATKLYSSCALIAAQDDAENEEMLRRGINPLSARHYYYCSSEQYEIAKTEPLLFIICTVENQQYYINSITLDKGTASWVETRKKFDNTNELNNLPSTMVITVDILSRIHKYLLPILDSALAQPNKTDISVYHLTFISKIADYCNAMIKRDAELHYAIYHKINTLLQYKSPEDNALSRLTGAAGNKYMRQDQSVYKTLLEKTCFMLASECYILGSKDKSINEAMLKQAFYYLQQWVTLSPHHVEPTTLASRMFILLQGASEGKQIRLTDTAVLGHDVIKNLLVNNSYEVFASIAKAMGTQYQTGFKDGKIAAQSNEGLQRAGMFAYIPIQEEMSLPSL